MPAHPTSWCLVMLRPCWIDRPAIDSVHPDDQRRWLTTDHPGQTRIRYRHADGSWRWIEARGTAVMRQGQVYLLAVGRDVTEQQRMETALAHQYSLVSAVIESTPDAVSVQDLTGALSDHQLGERSDARSGGSRDARQG